MVTRIIKLPKKQSFFLFGARGTGKTTVLEALFPKGSQSDRESLWIDLLSDEEEAGLSRNPDSLKQRVQQFGKTRHIIIDEIQKIPKLLDVVHQLIKDGYDKFILSGSSARKLKRGAANLLAGRAVVRSLFPLTHLEMADRFELNFALRFGTLPRLVHLDNEPTEIKDYLRAYSKTYLKEEIIVEQLVRNLDPFRGFLEVAAQMNGKIVNYSKIERDVGSSNKTIQSYYQILEETYVGFFLNAFHESWRKQLSQSPKFYFFDLGVTRALAGRLNQEVSESTYEYGDLFEQFIICEIFRLNEYFSLDFKMSYLRSKDGAEIDLILDRPGMKRALIEIKSSKMVRSEDLKHLRRFKSEHPKTDAYCLSLDPSPKRIDGIEVLPWKEGLIALGITG